MRRGSVAFWMVAGMTPRNRIAFEASQAVRCAVRQILLDHARNNPLARSPTAKQINALLPPKLRRTADAIRWHAREIRSHHANSSSDSDAA